ncbi:LysR family transcriptional regulator [Bordetella petrii]|uniref:LysR family transcriptional regulator n=1 Tax=Bordetella petrii TaxID=94624 RepID=UPI001E564AED|nr:LysR family transcriptional regulator [Bordetella petrii]MCD0501598.1 LysR family transcriptional regulator [Bordetella petrii]
MIHPDQPDLSAKELLAVKTVADYGSFNAAAIALEISQPVLTRTVQRVERQIGLTLFNRTTRSVEITDAGKEFVALAERVLNDMQIYLKAVQGRSAEQRGQVVIASVMSVACTVLPAIVARYKRDHPGVSIHVYEGVHGNVIESVRSGVADIGLTYLDDIASIFTQTPLSTQYFHVVLPKGHRLEQQRQVAWSALKNEQMVSLPSDSRTRRLIDATAVTAGLNLAHTITVTQFTTMMQFVAKGVGIGIVPEGTLADALSLGLVVRPLVRPKVSRVLGLVTLKEREQTPVARGMVEQVEREWRLPQR